MYAGIAGGADIILLPEIPYDISEIAKVIENERTSRKEIFNSCRCRGCNFKRRGKDEEERAKSTSCVNALSVNLL